MRKEEIWVDGKEDCVSPVPEPERLGVMNYIECLRFLRCRRLTDESLLSLKTYIDFIASLLANGGSVVFELEVGGKIPQKLAPETMEALNDILQDHEAVAALEDATEKLSPRNGHDEEVRHSGSGLGEVENSDKKMAKASGTQGIMYCENPSCAKKESKPMQFDSCGRCIRAVYCSRECQKKDWKRHKKECKSGENCK